MNIRTSTHSIACMAAAVATLCGVTSAQQDPACLSPNGDGEDMRYLWGGETRQVFHREFDPAPGAPIGEPVRRHVWTVGDGGHIRHRIEPPYLPGAPTWEFQDTPDDVRQTLLDVYFLEQPLHNIGWACGVNGHVLKTTNGGQQWDHAGNVISLDNARTPAEPATLWRVRFADEMVGFAVGLWTSKFTLNGGLDWQDIDFVQGPSNLTPLGFGAEAFEFYALEIIAGPNGSWTAVAAAQEWAGHPPTGSGLDAVVIMGSSLIGGGTKWWIQQDFSDLAPNNIQDPWDMEFEPGGQRGYLVGGTGNGSGAIYRTDTGGRSWVLEKGLSQGAISTQYGVAALGNGNVISCGYGGQIWQREAIGTTFAWSAKPVAGYSAPLAGAHGFEDENAWVTGAWGFVRKTSDKAQTFTDLNPTSAGSAKHLVRFEDIHFVDETKGVAVGQFHSILYSDDGGCSWMPKSGGPGAPGTFTKSPLHAIDFSAAAEGVAVGAANPSLTPHEDAIWYTADQGQTWNPATVPAGLTGTIRLLDVVHSAGSGPNANFWAVGEHIVGGVPEPLVLLSRTAGSSWMNATLKGSGMCQIPSQVRLNGVTFLNATKGYCVGYDTATGLSVAFEIDYGVTSICYIPVPFGSAASFDPARELLDIASNSTGDMFAVGKEGSVVCFNAQANRFDPVVDSVVQSFSLDFLSVDMAGSLLLAGTEALPEEGLAPQLGRILKLDGSTWSVIKAGTNKNMDNIHLQSADRGWAVSSGGDDPEFGKVGDSAMLIYDPN